MEHPLQNTVVMIVDDTFAHHQQLQNVLRNIGFSNCVVVENGESAEEAFRKNKIDFIISEIKLPKMSGIQLFDIFLQSLKKNEIECLKFIFFTSFASEENVKTIVKVADNCSADDKKRLKFDLVLKPLRIDKLLAKLQNVFSDKDEIKKYIDSQVSKLG